MTNKNFDYDIERKIGNKWSNEGNSKSETDAISTAKRSFNDPRLEAIRVIRNWKRPDGGILRTEIFSQIRIDDNDDKGIIGAVDYAPPPCETLVEYLSFDGRQLIQRLLQDYLRKNIISVTELLHSERELLRLQNYAVTLRASVDRVAYLQTRGTDKSPKVRRDEIFDAFENLIQLARKAEQIDLPVLTNSFSKMMAEIPKKIKGIDRDYFALTVLSTATCINKNWNHKLLLLCNLAENESEPHAMHLLDGVIADVLATEGAHDALKNYFSLGTSIVGMAEIAQGVFSTNILDSTRMVRILNALMKQGQLPLSRRSLDARIQMQLRSTAPLHTRDYRLGLAELRLLSTQLWSNGELFGGVDMAACLASRFTNITGQGGEFGRRMGMITAFGAMVDRASSVRFLCEVAQSKEGEDQIESMSVLFGQVYLDETLNDFCQPSLSAKDRLLCATAAHQAIMTSKFPDSVKQPVAQYIDALILRYLVDEKILERINRPTQLLRDRARQLLLFISSGVLPKGKALTYARNYTLEQLSQADFKTKFIEGIEDADQAKAALSDFYNLLSSTMTPN